MESVELEINGRMNTIHSDGSISFIHGRSGKLVVSFGYSNGRGYRSICICGKHYLVHRLVALAFLVEYSNRLQVDHINGDRIDNRRCNIRMVTCSQNLRAFSRSRGTSSSFRGVSLDARSGKWVSGICVEGKTKRLGSFISELEAAKAYDKSAKSMGYAMEALNFK